METLFQEAIAWYNLPLTILLGIILIYWIFVSLGVLGADSFDIDVDVDADVHHDFDVEHADHDIHAEAGGIGMVVLRFLNFGHVPAMIVISILIVVFWLISIFGNFLLNGLGSILVAGLIFFGGLILAGLATKVLTMPLKKVFAAMKMEGESKKSIVGRECIIRSATVDHTKGRAEVESDGVLFPISVRTAEGREAIPKNAKALIIDFNEENDTFLIKDLTE